MGQIVPLDQQHAEAAPDGVARDPRAIHAAADHDQIECAEIFHESDFSRQVEASRRRGIDKGSKAALRATKLKQGGP